MAVHLVVFQSVQQMDIELQILKHLKRDARPTVSVIDETGDRKKGNETDYVARQYLGSVGKIDNGIVTVNADGVYKNITFLLMFLSA